MHDLERGKHIKKAAPIMIYVNVTRMYAMVKSLP